MIKQNKKRIGFFLISLYGGGGEKVVLNLAKGFVEDGFNVDLLLFSRVGPSFGKINPRVNIIDLNVSRIFFSVFPIIRYLKKEKPAAILATSEHANIILLLAKIISRTKTKVLVRVGITFFDLFKLYKKRRDKLIPFLIKVLYPRADVIIANSRNVANNLEKVSKITKNKIKVIYNPKFISNIIEKSKQGEWNLPRDGFKILAVGRLAKQKDFQTLIMAFKKVRRIIPAQLIILGEGGEESNLKKLTDKLRLRDVYFLGYPGDDFSYFCMANSDLLISTSLWEGFSNVLVEASILGLPIIASDCGSGSRELLAPGTDLNSRLKKGNIEYTEYGVLFAVRDVDSLAKIILELSKNESLRQRYSEKLKQRSRAFDVKNILLKYKELIKDESI